MTNYFAMALILILSVIVVLVDSANMGCAKCEVVVSCDRNL